MSEPLDPITMARLKAIRAPGRSLYALPAPQPYKPPAPSSYRCQTPAAMSAKQARCEKVRRVANIMAGVFGIPVEAMTSHRRAKSWAWPRMGAMALAASLVPEASLPEIGQTFGGRDHTTVMHARDKTACRIATDGEEEHEFTALYRKAEVLCRAAFESEQPEVASPAVTAGPATRGSGCSDNLEGRA